MKRNLLSISTIIFGLLSLGTAVTFSACSRAPANENAQPADLTPKVYFTKAITP